jgi:hypothetical protein
MRNLWGSVAMRVSVGGLGAPPICPYEQCRAALTAFDGGADVLMSTDRPQRRLILGKNRYDMLAESIPFP